MVVAEMLSNVKEYPTEYKDSALEEIYITTSKPAILSTRVFFV